MNLLPLLLLVGFAQAQLSFEVASVRPAKGPGGVRGSCHGIDSVYSPNQRAEAPPLGRCVISNARLGHLIQIAYHLQYRGGPDWVRYGDDRFNVDAEAEDPTKATEAQLLGMLQALLEDRFRLKLHKETQEVQGFALVVAKNGPKMKGSKAADVHLSFGAGAKPQPGMPIDFAARKFSMANLAAFLGGFGQPVIDKTGLTANYDFTLAWDDTNGPSLTTAVQEQLGLKLESEKVTVTLLAVESAQKPTEN